MADFPGFIQPSLVAVPYAGLTANASLFSVPQKSSAWGADVGVLPAIFGIFANTQPVDELKTVNNAPSETQHGFVKDWYNHIHVTPLIIALGNILATQQRPVEVWNAYFVSQLLGSITAQNNASVVLTEPFPAPTTFNALESRLYDVSVSNSGPPIVNASYTFDFPSEDPVFTVTGNRLVVFASSINWRSQYIERFEWLTDVLESQDGSEQRISLRIAPRRTVEFEVMAVDGEKQYLDSILFDWQGRVFAVPQWPDIKTLDVDALVGALTLSVDTDYSDFIVEGLALLVAAYNDFEAVEIESLTQTSITIKNQLGKTWNRGSYIVPMKVGRVQPEFSLNQYLPHITRHNAFSFAIEDYHLITAAEQGPTYRGLALYDIKPQRAENLSTQFRRKQEVIDSFSGVRAVDDVADKSFVRHSYFWLKNSRVDIHLLRQWLFARVGKQTGVWIPTWTNDITLVSLISPTDVTIDIKNIGYNQFVKAAIGRRDIRIELNDGTVFLRRLSFGFVIDISTEKLGIDTSLGVQVDPSDVKQICYLMYACLSSDIVDIAYRYNDIATLNLIMKGLPDDV